MKGEGSGQSFGSALPSFFGVRHDKRRPLRYPIAVTALQQTLAAIVGPAHVLTRPVQLLVYQTDGLPGYEKHPRLAVFPATPQQVIEVVRALYAAGASWVARGAGTGLSGGALADDVVLLGLQRLRRIVAIDPEARTATVEPGVVNATLTKSAAPFGLHYAPDPSSQTACTIGGNVAENAGGPHCLKYGVTLNHVVSAKVVLPDGALVELITPESGAGYDLLGAFIGSEGCFGIAYEITVKLTPNPEGIRTMLADFPTMESAAQATSAIVAAGIVPAALELMDAATIQAVEASIYAAGYPTDAAAVLLVEVDGAEAGLDEDVRTIEALCLAHQARGVKVATMADERTRLWQGRKKAFGAMGRVASHLVVQDAVVPRTKLAAILVQIAEVGTRHRVKVCNVFHAGDGNLHPNIPYDATNADEASRVHLAMSEIMELCIAAGGTITGEHGVGLDKLRYMERLFPGDSLDAMCRLRDAFDPARRANPGKVVPSHRCREWLSAPGVEA
jgi:glycolate oxidase subunit GlcD